MIPILCLLSLLTAFAAGGWSSRYGFFAVLPEGWKAGLDALSEPVWGDLDRAGRAALAGELNPEDREIIMTGKPTHGFNHLAILEEEATLFADADRASVEAKFASYFESVPDAELTIRDDVPKGVWAEVRVAFEDGTVLTYVYWQIEPERLVIMSLFGATEPAELLLDDWEEFVKSITVPEETDHGSAVAGDDLQESQVPGAE